jgi:hypothetical protein
VCGGAPEIISNPLATSDDLTGSYNTTIRVWCNATAEDDDGPADIRQATAVLWDPSTTTAGGLDDADDHYTNSSCTLTTSGQQVNISCSLTLQWYAQPGEWSCNITVTDAAAASTSAAKTNITINQFKGLSTTGTLNFGSLAPGETTPLGSQPQTTVENRGNTPLNLNITANTNMQCTLGTINATQIHYDTTQTQYENMCTLNNPCTQTEQLNLRKKNSQDNTNPTQTIHWTIQIPQNTKGNCNNTIQQKTI